MTVNEDPKTSSGLVWRTRVSRLVSFLANLFTRYPRVLALFGFVSGVASFLLVERQHEYFAKIVSALMLVSWLVLTLEKVWHQLIAAYTGFRVPKPILIYGAQLVHQESLFFVIPFFFIATTWSYGQAVFTSLLMVAALISVVDPIYFGWLSTRKSIYAIFQGFTLLSVLLVTLPIIFRLSISDTYATSVAIATLLTIYTLINTLTLSSRKKVMVVISILLFAGFSAKFFHRWVPPATLWVTQLEIVQEIDIENRQPARDIKSIDQAQLSNGLFAYSSIHAPNGLKEKIYHAWYLNGNLVDKIPIEIQGGREAGYRAWSHKLNFPPYPAGTWRVEVVTIDDQTIATRTFGVTKSQIPSEALEPSTEQPHIYTSPEAAIREPVFEFLERKGRELYNSLSPD